ncbi:MAG: DUF3857 domain-containing protein [Gammaproteobacteria bacterium]
MRTSILVFLLATTLAPMALAQTAVSAPASKGASASVSFERQAPLPKWAQELAPVPATTRTDPVVTRLNETQALVGPTPALLFNRAIQVNDRASLGTIGQFGISFFPSYQKLALHRVAILRGGKTIDVTASVDTRLLEREAGIERGMFDGETTLQLLEDVRVGDTLWATWSVEGVNPVFGGHWSEDFGWDLGYPIERRVLTVLHPAARPVYWRQLGDFRTGRLLPVIDTVGELQRIRFDGRAIEALEAEPSVPAHYLPERMLQFSEHKTWQSVAQWAAGLFPRVTAVAELKALAQQFAAQPTQLAKASAALHWVQENIRYFSVSVGENSHRPQAPGTVLKRRYGDCKDVSYLLVSLLQQLGIEARPVLLSARAPRLIATLAPTTSWFDHAIVQVRIGTRTFYVDPTKSGQKSSIERLPQDYPGASVLVVDGATRELLVLPEVQQPPLAHEVVEKFSVVAVDGDAVLQLRHIYRDNYAEWARQRFASATAAELRKWLLEDYEKQYPGIVLVDTPRIDDDIGENRVEIAARFFLPKPIAASEHKYSLDYESHVMAGTLGIPDKVVRNYPFAPSAGKLRARYRLTIDWPATVQADDPPVQTVLDNAFYHLDEQYTLRGNRLDYLLDYELKRDQVEAREMADLARLSKKLNPFASAQFSIPKHYVRNPLGPGQSERDRDTLTLLADIAQIDDLLAGPDRSDASDGQMCDVIVDSVTLAHLTGKAVAPDARVERLIKPVEKTLCRARLAFADQRFGQAAALYASVDAMRYRPRHVRELAWAHLYDGKAAPALAVLAQAAGAAAGQENVTLNRADEIAILQRAGRPVPADLLAYAGAGADAPWPRPLLAMQVGVLSEEALFKVIDAMPSMTRALALGDGWFYIGQKRLARKDVRGATQAFATVATDGMRSSILFQQAVIELGKLRPATPAAARTRAQALEAAQLGDADAAFELAASHVADGRKWAAALPFYLKAAELGNKAAQLALVDAYANAKGTPQYLERARYWADRAGAQGDGTGLVQLGRMARAGYRMKQDVAIAHALFVEAAALGNVDAFAELAENYAEGSGVERNDRLATEWAEKAAAAGSRSAQFMLGLRLRTGTKKDPLRGRELVRQAAEAGYADAQERMGAWLAYDDKERDYDQAMAWMRKAADAQYPVAINNLGDMIENGLGAPQDYGLALSLYRQAAHMKQPIAFFSIASMLEKGLGMPRDAEMEYTYRKLAARFNAKYEPAAALAKPLSPDARARADAFARDWTPWRPLPGEEDWSDTFDNTLRKWQAQPQDEVAAAYREALAASATRRFGTRLQACADEVGAAGRLIVTVDQYGLARRVTVQPIDERSGCIAAIYFNLRFAAPPRSPFYVLLDYQ